MEIPYVTAETLTYRTSDWLWQLAPYNQHPMRLDVPASALLVVDMQTFFLDPASPTFTAGGPAVLPAVAGLISAFRTAGRPVIYTRHMHHFSGCDLGIMGWWWSANCVEGSPESEVHPALAPREDEKVIIKRRYSAFYGTDLETVLRGLCVRDLVITGVMTNLCCESTARDAYFRDYRVLIPADGTASVNEELHLASLKNLAFGFAFITTCAELGSQLVSPG